MPRLLVTFGNSRKREQEILAGYLFIVTQFASYKQSTHMCLKIFTKTYPMLLAGFVWRHFQFLVICCWEGSLALSR